MTVTPAAATPPAPILRRSYWTCLSASVAGVYHRQRGENKQDTLAVRNGAPDSPNLFVAVADGAGNAACAQQGSIAAVKAASETVAERRGRLETPRETLIAAHAQACEAVTQTARQANHAPREYATTLLLVMVRDGRLAVVQTGDGGVILRDAVAGYRLALPPQKGEYNNETCFITDTHNPQPEKYETDSGTVTGIAVFSDGLERVLLSRDRQPHPPALEPLFRWADLALDTNAAQRELERYWQSSRIAERTRDDITICIAVRQPKGNNG